MLVAVILISIVVLAIGVAIWRSRKSSEPSTDTGETTQSDQPAQMVKELPEGLPHRSIIDRHDGGFDRLLHLARAGKLETYRYIGPERAGQVEKWLEENGYLELGNSSDVENV